MRIQLRRLAMNLAPNGVTSSEGVADLPGDGWRVEHVQPGNAGCADVVVFSRVVPDDVEPPRRAGGTVNPAGHYVPPMPDHYVPPMPGA